VTTLLNKRILITGGTGSWGTELVRQLLTVNYCKNITVVSRNEANSVFMSRKYPKVKYLLGDVRDYEKIYNVLENIDVVFHLAAVKHVPICESQPEEAINTNINGTLNLVKACKRRNIKDLILISTDKAVEPINTYGISKAMAEKIVLNAGYKVIRAGNVIGSSGSVIPLFKEQIIAGQEVTLTHENMTRFFFTLYEAIRLVLRSVKMCGVGEIIILKMPSFKLMDVIKVLGDGDNVPVRLTGIRPGEKLHEILIGEGEANNAYYMNYENLIIITEHPDESWIKVKGGLSSENIETNLNILKNLLQKAGYVNS